MMKSFPKIRICLLCTLTFYPLYLKGQIITKDSLKAVIIDSLYKKPLINAHIDVIANDGSVICSSISDKLGQFKIPFPIKQKWVIIASALGYQNKKIDYETVQTNTITPFIITLSPLNLKLKEVVIWAPKQLITIKPNELIYNAAEDSTNKGINALQVIQKAPLIFVDNNGNIYLRGSKNLKILFNGKESNLTGDVSKLLGAMPSDLIKSVEVITSPSAKYTDREINGVINVVTEHKGIEGYFASVNAGVDERGGYNGSIYLTTEIGKLGFSGNANYFFNKGVSNKTFLNINYVNDSLPDIEQSGDMQHQSIAETLGLSLSYEIDTFTLINASFYHYGTNEKTSQYFLSESIYPNKQVSSLFERTISENTVNGFFNYGIDLQRSFKTKGQLLDFSFRQDIKNNNINYNALQEDWNSFDSYTQLAINKGKTKGNTAQVDYVLPIKKNKLEIGIKGIFRNIVSNYNYYYKTGSDTDFHYDSLQSNLFHYRMTILSIYGSYNLIFNNYNAQVGARLEKTDLNYSTTSHDYLNFLPILTLGRKLTNKSTINISYNRYLYRAGIRYLDPFVNKMNPYSITFGNPELEPEIVDKIWIDYNTFLLGNLISISPYYRFSKNSIQPYYYTNDSILVRSFANNSKYGQLGVNFYGEINPLKKWALRLDLDVSYFKIKNLQENNIYNQNINYNISVNSSYYFPHDLTLGFSGYFYSPEITFQGKKSGYYESELSISKKLFKKRGSIRLSLSQPFQKIQKQMSYYNGNGFSEVYHSGIRDRYLILNFTYNFGKLKSYLKRTAKTIQNNELKQ